MCGGSSKPSGQVTTVTSNDPPAFQQPFIQFGLEEAKKQFQSDKPSFFPNSTVVPFSNQTEAALGQIENRAMTGSDLLRRSQGTVQGIAGGSTPQTGIQNIANIANANPTAPAQGLLMNTATGGMLNSNPYIDQTFQRGADQIRSNVAGQFAGSGRYGSGAMARSLGDTLGNYATGLYGQNLANERGLQQQAQAQLGQFQASDYGQRIAANQALQGQINDQAQLQLAGSGLGAELSQMDYNDPSRLLQVGGARESLAQSQLQDQINRFNFDQTNQQDKLARYMALTSGGQFGGTSTATQPIFNNPLATGLGAASSAVGILGTLFGKQNGIFT